MACRNPRYGKEKASPSSDGHVKAGNALNDSESKTLLPIGWKQPLWEGKFFTPYQHGEHTKIFAWTLAVWFMTAVALSLGARFWFDLLNKFMVVRSTIKPQEKSEIEKSKD
jgi:hypothetical protein